MRSVFRLPAVVRPARPRRISSLLLALVAIATVPDAMATAICPAGQYQDPSSLACVFAPAGTYSPGGTAQAPIAAPAGFFVSQSGQSAPQSCPTGSYSYGSATACRRTTSTATNSSIVGPAFGSDIGLFALSGQSFTFDLSNDTADTASPSNLTDLTLKLFEITGPDAASFSIVPPSDTVLSKGEHASLVLNWLGGSNVPFSITLKVSTDQNACFDGLTSTSSCTNSNGQTFSFLLSGTGQTAATTGGTVPEPASLALVGLAGIAGMVASAGRRRWAPRAASPA